MDHIKGTFVLSFDVEFVWGFIENVTIDKWMLKSVEKVREILDPLLRLIGDYNVPVTWAIVGHLFLDHCDCEGVPHPNMPRPDYKWFEGDWYKYDPCSDISSAPHWYGRDIVEKIIQFAKESTVDQEIGCHSFSHQMFGDQGCSRELACAEVDECLRVMRDYNIHPKTFVFPLGSVGHIDVIKEKGFVAFCSSIPRLVNRSSLGKSPFDVIRKYISLGTIFCSYYFLLPPPVVEPKKVLPGLWNIPSSMCFNKKRGIPVSLVVLKAKKGVQRAVREKKCFHMFTHLHNFGVMSNTLLRGFEDILSFVNRERERGRLEAVTIRKLKQMQEG